MWDPQIMNYDTALGCLWMAAQYATVISQDVQRKGLIIIWDYTGFTINHMLATDHRKLLSMANHLQVNDFQNIF